MRRTRVKICGLTRSEDVVAAVEAGADACGFIFAPSPRQVNIEQVSALAHLVPPPVARVGVFVDAEPEFVEEAIRACGLTAVQFSGSEAPVACARVSVPVIKVFAVGTDFGWSITEPYRGNATAVLLDTYDSQRAGGTSQSFSWQSIGEVPGWAPFYVAGGLTADNVAEVVRILSPFAVDVSSGVESSPGIKDHGKMRAFCAAVQSVDWEVGR